MVSVRSADYGDVSQVVAVAHRCRDQDPSFEVFSAEQYGMLVQLCGPTGPAEFLVAVDEDDLVTGFVLGYSKRLATDVAEAFTDEAVLTGFDDGEHLLIKQVAVLTAGEGVGSVLYASLPAQRRLYVGVPAENTQARIFHEAQGFDPVLTYRHPRTGVERVIFAKGELSTEDELLIEEKDWLV